MAKLINHHSFLVFVIPVLLVLLYFLLRPPGSTLKQILAMALLAAAVAVFFLARPGGSASSGQGAEARLADAGKPTLLEVYSNY
ncbi:MAG: hypothetical protein JSW55_00055 [Chloroflexota bacterium]|nr:MAG: hypothetical protein JSW55_00055 [Chloroflexota bacterium]